MPAAARPFRRPAPGRRAVRVIRLSAGSSVRPSHPRVGLARSVVASPVFSSPGAITVVLPLASSRSPSRRLPVGERHRRHLRAADAPRPPRARRVPTDGPLRALARGSGAHPRDRGARAALGDPLVPRRAAPRRVRLELDRSGDPLLGRGSRDHPDPRPHALRLPLLAAPRVRERRLPARRRRLCRRRGPALQGARARLDAAQRAADQRPAVRQARRLAPLSARRRRLHPPPAAPGARHPPDGRGAQGGRSRRGDGPRRGRGPRPRRARRPAGAGGRGPAARLPLLRPADRPRHPRPPAVHLAAQERRRPGRAGGDRPRRHPARGDGAQLLPAVVDAAGLGRPPRPPHLAPGRAGRLRVPRPDRRLLPSLPRAGHGHRDERARRRRGALALARHLGRPPPPPARRGGAGPRLHLVPAVHDDRLALPLRQAPGRAVPPRPRPLHARRGRHRGNRRPALAGDAARRAAPGPGRRPRGGGGPPAAARLAGDRVSAGGAAPDRVYVNPVYPRSFPDPFVLRFRGEYWAYCTGFWTDGRCFGVLHSRDLVRWRERAGAMAPLPGGHTCYWAPEVVYLRGLFYLYYSVGNEERMEIRVAIADRPEGPF